MTTRRRIPDLLVEKLYLGELEPDAADAVRRRLNDDGELGRLEAARSDEGLGDALPAIVHQRIAAARARRTTARRTRRHTLALAVTAAALALGAVAVGQSADPALVNRVKGGPALVIYRQLPNGGHEVLTDGATARAGDTIQLAVSGGDTPRAAIYSLDGRGTVTEHLPPGPIPSRSELRLPNAFVLDDAPRFERFFLVLGDALDARQIRQALAVLDDPLASPLEVRGARVVTLTLVKGTQTP